jgi:hypothetical protein
MKFSFMFMFPAPLDGRPVPDEFTEAYARSVVESLGVGVIEQVDIFVEEGEFMDGPGRTKLFFHMTDATPAGTQFAASLADVEKRQKENERGVWPKKIVYGTRRDGRDKYYQVFKTATLAERAAAHAAKASGKTKPVARIV